jgi:hypothetical protein
VNGPGRPTASPEEATAREMFDKAWDECRKMEAKLLQDPEFRPVADEWENSPIAVIQCKCRRSLLDVQLLAGPTVRMSLRKAGWLPDQNEVAQGTAVMDGWDNLVGDAYSEEEAIVGLRIRFWCSACERPYERRQAQLLQDYAEAIKSSRPRIRLSS